MYTDGGICMVEEFGVCSLVTTDGFALDSIVGDDDVGIWHSLKSFGEGGFRWIGIGSSERE